MNLDLAQEIKNKCEYLFKHDSYVDKAIYLCNDNIKLNFWKGQWEFTWLQYEMRTKHIVKNLASITFKNDVYRDWMSNEPINIAELCELLNENKIVIIKDNNDFLLGLKPIKNTMDVELFFSTRPAIKAEQENILEYMCYQATYLNKLFTNLEF